MTTFSRAAGSFRTFSTSSSFRTFSNSSTLRPTMWVLELLPHSLTSTSLLVAMLGLLLAYLLFSTLPRQDSKAPPGPRPLPLLGNLLQLDLKEPHCSLMEVSWVLSINYSKNHSTFINKNHSQSHMQSKVFAQSEQKEADQPEQQEASEAS